MRTRTCWIFLKFFLILWLVVATLPSCKNDENQLNKFTSSNETVPNSDSQYGSDSNQADGSILPNFNEIATHIPELLGSEMSGNENKRIFEFNDTDPSNITDSSGAMRVELHNVALKNLGGSNSVLEIKKDNNGYAVLSNSENILSTQQFTIRVRALVHEDTEDWSALIYKPYTMNGGCENPYQAFGIQIRNVYNQDSYKNEANINFALGTQNFSVDLTSDNTIVFDKWLDIEVSFDGITMRLYIDGKLEGRRVVHGNMIMSGESVYLGRSIYCNPQFSGEIDRIEFISGMNYDALPDQDISNRVIRLTNNLNENIISQTNASVYNPIIVQNTRNSTYKIAVAGRRMNETGLKYLQPPVKDPDSGNFQLAAEFVSPIGSSAENYSGKFHNAAQGSFNLNDENNIKSLSELMGSDYLPLHNLSASTKAHIYKIKIGDIFSIPAAIQITNDYGFVGTPDGFKSGVCYTANVIYGLLEMFESKNNYLGAKFVAINRQYHKYQFLTYSLDSVNPEYGITFYYPTLDLSFKFSGNEKTPKDLEITIKIIPLLTRNTEYSLPDDYTLIGQLYSNYEIYTE